MKRRSVWVVEGIERGKWTVFVMYRTRRPAEAEARISKRNGSKVRVVRYDAAK